MKLDTHMKMINIFKLVFQLIEIRVPCFVINYCSYYNYVRLPYYSCLQSFCMSLPILYFLSFCFYFASFLVSLLLLFFAGTRTYLE